MGTASGYKKPGVLGVLACGTASARPYRVTQEVLLFELAGTKVLRLRGVIAQSEAGGQVGEVPVAVSWGLRPGAPRGGVACGEVGVPAQGRHVLRGPSM